MKPSLQLDAAHQALLRQLLARALPGATVGVFGSRARGQARPYSDVDLLICKPPRLTWEQRVALADALEASELPFRVDIVEIDRVPAGMRTRMLSEMQPL